MLEVDCGRKFLYMMGFGVRMLVLISLCRLVFVVLGVVVLLI